MGVALEGRIVIYCKVTHPHLLVQVVLVLQEGAHLGAGEGALRGAMGGRAGGRAEVGISVWERAPQGAMGGRAGGQAGL